MTGVQTCALPISQVLLGVVGDGHLDHVGKLLEAALHDVAHHFPGEGLAPAVIVVYLGEGVHVELVRVEDVVALDLLRGAHVHPQAHGEIGGDVSAAPGQYGVIHDGVALDHADLCVQIAHVDQQRAAIPLLQGEHQQAFAQGWATGSPVW